MKSLFTALVLLTFISSVWCQEEKFQKEKDLLILLDRHERSLQDAYVNRRMDSVNYYLPRVQEIITSLDVPMLNSHLVILKIGISLDKLDLTASQINSLEAEIAKLTTMQDDLPSYISEELYYNTLLKAYSHLAILKLREKKTKEAIRIMDIYERKSKLVKTDKAFHYGEMAIFCNAINEYNQALYYYELSLPYYMLDFLKYTIYNYSSHEVSHDYYYQKARIANCLNNIGVCHELLGDYKKAQNMYFTAYGFVQDIEGSENLVALVSYNAAYLFYINGYENDALILAKEALEYYQKAYGNNHIETAEVYDLNADIEAKRGDLQKALEYYEKALVGKTTYYGSETHQNIAITHRSLGEAYLTTHSFTAAEHHLKAARNCIKNKKSRDFLYLQLSLVELYLIKQNFSQAEKTLKKVEQQFDDGDFSKDSYFYISFLIRKGDLKIAQTEIEAAKTNYQLAHSMLDTFQYRLGKKDFGGYKNLITHCTNESEQEAILWEALSRCATQPIHSFSDLKKLEYNQIIYKDIFYQLLEKYGQVLLEKRKIEAAIQYLSLAYQQMINSRNNFVSSQGRYQFQEKLTALKNKILEACLQSKEDHFELMWNIVEESKSTFLLENIQGLQASEALGISKTLLEKERSLQSEIITLQEQVQAHNESALTTSDSLKQLLFSKQEDYKYTKQEIALNHPKYHQLKYNISPIGIKKIQENLNQSTTLLHYSLLSDSTAIALILTPSTYQAILLSHEQGFTIGVNQLRKAIQDNNINDFSEIAHRLYQDIFQPLESSLSPGQQLIIIPDGVLYYLPLEVLPKNKTLNFSTLNYLLEDYEISYHYSATLRDLQQKEKHNKTIQFRGFATDFKNAHLDELPYAKKEVQELSKIWKGKQFIEGEATLKAFHEESTKANILHFAGHTEINPQNPLHSKLFFNASGDSLTSLKTYEIYNLQLQSDLTFLSACNTGIGAIKQGEGVVSLARGFAHAGCPSVMMTLWAVSDSPTYDIAIKTNKKLQKGQRKGKALQHAKLEYLAQARGEMASPYFWGGIVLVGNNDELIAHSSSSTYSYILMVLVAFIIAITFVYFKKRRNMTRQHTSRNI